MYTKPKATNLLYVNSTIVSYNSQTLLIHKTEHIQVWIQVIHVYTNTLRSTLLFHFQVSCRLQLERIVVDCSGHLYLIVCTCEETFYILKYPFKALI